MSFSAGYDNGFTLKCCDFCFFHASAIAYYWLMKTQEHS